MLALEGMVFGHYLALAHTPFSTGAVWEGMFRSMFFLLLVCCAINYLITLAHNSWIRQNGVKGQVDRELIPLDWNWQLDAIVIGLAMAFFLFQVVVMSSLYLVLGEDFGFYACLVYAFLPFFWWKRVIFQTYKLLIRLHFRINRDKGMRAASA